jgi:hypothetical protein
MIIFENMDFVIDKKYKKALDRQFTPASYDELYTAWLKAKPYYVRGWNEPILCDLTANTRPTLTVNGEEDGR